MINFLTQKAIDYCDDVRDGTHDSPKHLDSGYLLITSKNIKNGEIDFENVSYISKEDFKKINQRSLVEINDILYSMIGTVGLVYRVEERPNYAIKNMGLFKISDELKSKWLYYFLNTPVARREINSKLSGSTQKFISLSNLRGLNIMYPEDINIQKKVIYILEKIDYKIKLNKMINNSLCDITNKLYEETFVKNRNNSWNEYNLLDLVEIINGYSYTGKELAENSNIGMATIKNFERTGGFKEDGFKSLFPIKSKAQQEAKMFDILVACTDLTQNADIIGNAIMLLNTNNFDKIILSMDLVKVLPKNNPFTIYSILNSKEFKNHALGYKSGTTVLHLNKTCFKDFNIKLPNQRIIEEFEKIAEANYKKISANLRENQTLFQLKDTLLPKLMNGEIDLDNIEI